MRVMNTRSSGPADAANFVSALVTSSRVDRPETRASPSAGSPTRYTSRSEVTPRRSDASASVLPHRWNVFALSGSPDSPTTISRKTFSMTRRSGQPHEAAIRPLGAHEAHERDENNRHIPQLAFLDRRHAASRVADVFSQSFHRLWRIELATGLFRDSPHRSAMHRWVEELCLAWTGAHETAAAANRLAAGSRRVG